MIEKNICPKCKSKLQIVEYYTGSGHIIWKMNKNGSKSKKKIDCGFYSDNNSFVIECQNDECDYKHS